MYCIVSNTMKKLFGFRKKKKGTSHVSSASLNSYQQGDAVLTKTNLPPKSNVLYPESVNRVPFLVQELQNCKKTSSDHAAHILRKLFTLSEQPNGQSVEVTRKEMIQDGKLVPALFTFCERCREEPEQQQENGVVQQPQLYLALLVLNNISIPMENKRKIALDYHGAAFLSKFLCDEPSCHLVAIVLVNLTFADAALRKDLVLTPGIHLMESLAFAFRVASMTTAEYISHKESLEDPKIEAVLTWLPKVDSAKDLPPPSSQKYPDTVRWTISAIRNLTRPTPGNPSIVALINTGVVTCILQSLSIRPHILVKTADVSFESLSSNESPVATEPLERGYENHPSTWGAQSYQDAALSVILNLATDPSTRSYLRKETDTMQVLVSITECGATLDKTFGKKTSAITRLQCIKARMALAYLLGSEGHFGQAKSETGRMVYYPGSNSDFLTTNESELEHLVELFSNTLERRAKDGPGGYSATAFNFKSVLFAIRCLLSHPTNQAIFAATQMEEFNGLFLKVLGLHALQQAKMVDTEAAEYACFSMYLLSHYGFHKSFLPGNLGRGYNVRSLVAKILTSYLDRDDITPAAAHAAKQLLLRIKYLVVSDATEATEALVFDRALVTAAKKVVIVEKIHSGTQPRADIFNRAVVRSSGASARHTYPNALQAVQDFSFGSTKVRHVSDIDDIMIANNIAMCSNGKKTESYGYRWSWKDDDVVLEESDPSVASPDSKCHNFSILGLTLGKIPNLCGVDTTAP